MKTNLSRLLLALLILSGLRAVAVTRYVDLNSPSPTPPYLDWSTAAANIQDAIDAGVDGDLVLVTNGVYGQGGRVVFGAMSNRVAVTKRVAVQSVNGPNVTVIQGYKVPGTINGDSAVRCVYLTNGAWLVGFTVTNGATRTTGDDAKERSGGGVWCEQNTGVMATHAFVSNCIIAFNSASLEGGGGYNGQYRRSIIMTNLAFFGGGISRGAVCSCLIVGNYAYSRGGGIYGSGSYANSGNTVVGNFASDAGGGVYLTAINNSIVYFNSGTNHSQSTLRYCCTVPVPPFPDATEVLTNAPKFIDSAALDFRLQSVSSCINAGDNYAVLGGEDLAGNQRISGGTVDMGAYELQSPASILSYAWAQQNGLPTDGSVDFIDIDGDGANTWQEWRAGTSYTNAQSVLRILSVTNAATGLKVTWQSVNTRFYYLQRSTNIGVPSSFQTIASGILGMPSTTNRTDTTATNGGPYFYRVGVQ